MWERRGRVRRGKGSEREGGGVRRGRVGERGR